MTAMTTETAQHYTLIEDDPDFGMAAGDVLACVPYDYEKLTVCFRLADDFNPECNVYREQVRKVDGSTEVAVREEPPYGFIRAEVADSTSPDLAPAGHVWIDVLGEPDSLGRVQMMIFWLDTYLPPEGMRGQISSGVLAAVVQGWQTATNRRPGKTVHLIHEDREGFAAFQAACKAAKMSGSAPAADADQ